MKWELLRMNRAERRRAEWLAVVLDRLIEEPDVPIEPADPEDAELLDTARLLTMAIQRLGTADPALEQQVIRASQLRARAEPALRLPRLRPAWAIAGLVALLLAFSLLTPLGHAAVAGFMAVFRLGRTEVHVTPVELPKVTATATAVARSTAVQEELTFEEVQAQVAFSIPQPARLPAGYHLRAANTYTYPDLPAWVPQPFAIQLVYEDADGHQIDLRVYPIALGEKATISRLNLEATSIEDVRDVEVNGRPGVLLQVSQSRAETLWQEVVWEQGDLILALSSADLSEKELLQAAESIR